MRKRTPQDFINDAKEVHMDKFDYSEVNYVNRITKVKIICPKHGEFFQRPGSLVGMWRYNRGMSTALFR